MLQKKIFLVITVLWLSSAFSSEISYIDVGDGQPLILIHAFPTDARLWEPQRKGLQQNFRVITPDLSGFGESSPVDGHAITMAEYADQVKQLLDQLNISKAIIGGESMGGYIALAFLKKYPDRIDGLVLSNTQSFDDSEETKAKREAGAIDVLKNGTAKLIDDFMPKALSPHASDETRLTLRNILQSQSPTAIASALRGMALREDTSGVLARAQVPILIITGDQDSLIPPEQSLHMHHLAKNSLLAYIHAAHLSSLERPEDWNDTVTFWFSRSKIH